jgi:hypothetical protein
MLEEIAGLAVFGLFHGVRFLVRLALQPQRIAISAELQVVDLPMTAIVLGRVDTLSGVQRAHLKAGLTQDLHGCAAASTRSHHDRVEHSGRHWGPP